MRNLILQIAPKKICLVLFTSFVTTIVFGQDIAFELVPHSFADFDSVKYSSIAFADIDGDDDQDVLITGDNNSYEAISKLYKNDGSGNYTLDLDTTFDAVMNGSVAFADIDGDSDLDVLITGRKNFSLSSSISKLYKNNGLGYFTLVSGTPFEGVFFSSVAFADIDGDDDQDLLITGRINTGVVFSSNLYTNDGNGNYTLVNNTPFDQVASGTSDFADIDGDGDQDVLITGGKTDYSRISNLYTNDGAGNFTLVDDTPFDPVRGGSVAFADIDGDGDLDVLITGKNNNSFRIAKLYTNDGLGNFTLVNNTPFLGVFNGSVAFADIDSDNDQDVLITGYFGEILTLSYLYINDGGGNYTIANETLFEGASDGSIAFADIDGDNDQDVLITGRNGNNKRLSNLYRNNTYQSVGIDGNIFFKEVSIYPNPSEGMVNIDLGNLDNVSIKVLSLSGRMVYQKESINTSVYQFELNEAPGIYFFEITFRGKKQQIKLVIN